MGKRPQPRLRIDALTGEWRNGDAGEGRGSELCEPGGLRHQAGGASWRAPTRTRWGGYHLPDQVAPRGRKASSTRKIKPQTSNHKPPATSGPAPCNTAPAGSLRRGNALCHDHRDAARPAPIRQRPVDSDGPSEFCGLEDDGGHEVRLVLRLCLSLAAVSTGHWKCTLAHQSPPFEGGGGFLRTQCARGARLLSYRTYLTLFKCLYLPNSNWPTEVPIRSWIRERPAVH